MSSIRCTNGTLHMHSSVHESKVCYGLIARPTPAPITEPSVTVRQLDYIRDLGGDMTYAAKLTKVGASSYIDRLKKAPKPVTEPPAPRPQLMDDPRMPLISGMIDMVPVGYYAVRKDDSHPIHFLRISRPKADSKNQYAGSTKFQSQHGPRLELRMVKWASGRWSTMDRVHTEQMIADLMLVIADQHGASLRYAQEIGRCMRCNAELTDQRSRFYGIGPECEFKYGYGWVIETVDFQKGGSYEEHLRRGTLALLPSSN